MAVKLIVAVTDDAWFEQLRGRDDLTEVNFWAPGGTPFRALQSGELFLFKLHAPRHFIVGGGYFLHANQMPCSLAWGAFGVANGCTSAAEMRNRIAKYRHTPTGDRSDFVIGCRILTQPFFLAERDWIQVPESFARKVVSFKTYSTDDPDRLHLWKAAHERMPHHLPGLAEGNRYGEPCLVQPRLGQGAFRVLVTDAYQRRCAVTQERTLPALEAAHIRPYANGGDHDIRNGLLLRRDIHSLFDLGYVTVTPDRLFRVSQRIRAEYENGRHYYEMDGRPITEPANTLLRPDSATLQWHNVEVFRG